MILKKDMVASDFELKDDKGGLHHLSDLRGKQVVLYFYPKDDTPGCTKEACSFRDDYEAFQKKGIEIIGVSPDTSESHAKFREKYELPFLLLADIDHHVCEQYGVWGKKKLMGSEYFGVMRTTFLINEKGKIVKVFEGVKPADHSQEVLAEFNKNKQD